MAMVPQTPFSPPPQDGHTRLVRIFDETVEYVSRPGCQIGLAADLLKGLYDNPRYRAERLKAIRLRMLDETDAFLRAALSAEA